MTAVRGVLRGVRLKHAPVVDYSLKLDEEVYELAPYLGRRMTMTYHRAIYCLHCGGRTKSSYGGGYCYPCFAKIPQCDVCMVNPELCHYHQGSCRNAQWGLEHCFQEHALYMAYTSSVKVGITRRERLLERWMEQGATEAIVLGTTQDRKTVGDFEQFFKRSMNDKTHWRNMLRDTQNTENLLTRRNDLLNGLQSSLPERLRGQMTPSNEEVQVLRYPVLVYPPKVISLSLDKQNDFQGILMGMKGSYLIFEREVFSVKKHQGYEISIDFC